MPCFPNSCSWHRVPSFMANWWLSYWNQFGKRWRKPSIVQRKMCLVREVGVWWKEALIFPAQRKLAQPSLLHLCFSEARMVVQSVSHAGVFHSRRNLFLGMNLAWRHSEGPSPEPLIPQVTQCVYPWSMGTKQMFRAKIKWTNNTL